MTTDRIKTKETDPVYAVRLRKASLALEAKNYERIVEILSNDLAPELTDARALLLPAAEYFYAKGEAALKAKKYKDALAFFRRIEWYADVPARIAVTIEKRRNYHIFLLVLVITLLCVVMIGGNVWASCVEHRRVERINRAKEERRLQERERILKEKQKNSPPPQQQNFHAQ